MHRDSTGVVQRIEPGAVNWMSAGRGIVHSERTPKDLLDRAHRSHGLQLWVALPEALEDSAPSFQHLPAASIPRVRVAGATVHVVAGSAFGATSPVATSSPTLALVLDFDVASGERGRAARRRRGRARALRRSTIRSRSTASRTTSCTMVVLAPGADARAGGAARRPRRRRRRRIARPPLRLVELRRQHARADPRRRGRLARSALRQGPGRDRIHPASGALPRRAGRRELGAGVSMSALPATASAAPTAVSASGRNPSKASETTRASSGVITPTVPAAPGPTRS